MTMPNESILSTGFHLYILPSWGRDPSDVYLMRVQLSINRMNHYKHGANHCLPSNDSLKKKKSLQENVPETQQPRKHGFTKGILWACF